MLFSLAWFHAILLERRKFKSLGFNVPYEFNESDFSICHDLVIVFLDEVRPTKVYTYLAQNTTFACRPSATIHCVVAHVFMYGREAYAECNT